MKSSKVQSILYVVFLSIILISCLEKEPPTGADVEDDEEPAAFYLAENVVTIMCPTAQPGDVGVVDGVEYEAVDRSLLIERRGEGAGLTKVCTSLVTNMSGMFSSNDAGREYSENFNQDISRWDVSNVTNMERMFEGAYSFNRDIGSWDVSNVTDMSFMFNEALVFNSDIGDWNVSSVSNMSGMFASALQFKQDIRNWNVSSVTNMSYMFIDADTFNSDLANWDVSNVTEMSFMFSVAHEFNQDIGNWDVSNVTNMSNMFSAALKFNKPINMWDVGRVINMSEMFQSANAFNQHLNEWDVSSVADMSSMFRSADTFNSDIGSWDVSSVTDMSYMFYDALAFNSDLANWDVSNVTDMSFMFFEAPNFNQDIGSWDVNMVTKIQSMFEGANSFNQDIGSWVVSSVTNMSHMFRDADTFNSDLANWDVSNVTDMSFMFYEAESFNKDLSNWCVENISTEPSQFSTNSPLIAEYHPVWGTCPESTKVVEVTNPVTGRVWMDRNLGARRAATSMTDEEAYGDLYQWGRAADGHQKRNSSTTSTLSSSDQPGHGDFILAPNSPYDWRSPQNDNLWQGVNGVNNPCPEGFRLPTATEWEAERESWSSNDADGAFASSLKLPRSGTRDKSNGSLSVVGTSGFYLSSTVDGEETRYVFFYSTDAFTPTSDRARGYSIRCIKD